MEMQQTTLCRAFLKLFENRLHMKVHNVIQLNQWNVINTQIRLHITQQILLPKDKQA